MQILAPVHGDLSHNSQARAPAPHSLSRNNDPLALVPDADGNFYGTTYVGGANGDGVIYTLTPVLGGH